MCGSATLIYFILLRLDDDKLKGFSNFKLLPVLCLSFIIYIHWTVSLEFPPVFLLLLEALASCWGVELGRGHGKVTFITCLIIKYFRCFWHCFWKIVCGESWFDVFTVLWSFIICVATCRMDRDRFFGWILGHVIVLWGLMEKWLGIIAKAGLGFLVTHFYGHFCVTRNIFFPSIMV